MECAYRFVLEVRSTGGAVLHRETSEPDWEPLLQGARLSGLRTVGVWQQPGGVTPTVEPVWHPAAGQPFITGLRVHMHEGERTWVTEFPSAYFGDAARAVVTSGLAAGTVSPGDQVIYAVAAYPVDSPRQVAGLGFDAVDRPQRLDMVDRGFSAIVAGAIPSGSGEVSDFEVVVPDAVLDEVRESTRAAGECETGGILIGHVCHDDARHDMGVEVTAQIPARHTLGDRSKLTFTSETWTDVRAAVALRRSGERLLGWWHSHPAVAWCATCPVERQRVCQLATGFLSADDRALHRAMFPEAFTQALVVTHSVAGIETRLFGWRNALLQPRAFRVSGRATSDSTDGQSIPAATSGLVEACAPDHDAGAGRELAMPGL